MNALEWLSGNGWIWAGALGLLGVGLGVVGIILVRLAGRNAKSAITIARNASTIAKEAREAGDRARKFAEDAAARYAWEFILDADGFPSGIMNDNPNPASNVVATITAGDTPAHTITVGDVDKFASALIDLDPIKRAHFDRVKAAPPVVGAMSQSASVPDASEVQTLISAWIVWQTPAGFTHQENIDAPPVVHYRRVSGRPIRVTRRG